MVAGAQGPVGRRESAGGEAGPEDVCPFLAVLRSGMLRGLGTPRGRLPEFTRDEVDGKRFDPVHAGSELVVRSSRDQEGVARSGFHLQPAIGPEDVARRVTGLGQHDPALTASPAVRDSAEPTSAGLLMGYFSVS